MPRKRVITVWTRAEMLGWMIDHNDITRALLMARKALTK